MSTPRTGTRSGGGKGRPGHRLDDTDRPRAAQSPRRRSPLRPHRGWASRRRIVSVATAAVALALGVLGCELVLRWVWRGDNVHTTATLGVFAADPELGWVNRPNLDAQRQWAGRVITIRTDEEGRRVPEPAPVRAPDQHLAFAGDSFVFGNEVDAEETFVELVGRAVDTKTVNLGVGGYKLGQSALTLARYLERHPDVGLGVLVNYIGNDLEYGAHPSPGLRVDAHGLLVSAAPGPAADLRAFALRRSRLFFALYTIWRRMRPEPATPQVSAAPRVRWIYDEGQLGQDRLAEHRAVLARLDQRARSLGVPLLVVLLPERGQVYGDLGDLPNRTLEVMLADLGLARLDLLPPMRSAAVERPPLWHDVVQGHLSGEGHRVVAEALTEWIADSRGRQTDGGRATVR